jgi:chaperonin cofactor prefoldin
METTPMNRAETENLAEFVADLVEALENLHRRVTALETKRDAAQRRITVLEEEIGAARRAKAVAMEWLERQEREQRRGRLN